ncbi:lactonase family protein [Paraburkholderia rhizosphaerae]|uniref:6-phosphogluconolactonase n=1 Tax=Paraburkholderia rhizosphaerae TaxID=480658 RepID=A0A4R8LIX9_9BURK|nr:beta-propeller fold lactonase family protein [Paraburkholderia rhizosphaerae]TDY43318.1 6-phosphogluconolactonase [Paraburkholderia rhizosphaerae]
MKPVYSVFVSNAADGDIGAYRFDTENGTLEPEARYVAGDGVAPLALSRDSGTLYAATRGDRPSIVTYALDTHSGALKQRGVAHIDSKLVHLCVDASGHYLLGASYHENRATLYDAASVAEGDARALQTADGIEHAHAAVFTGDGRFAYVSSLGGDAVFCFAMHNGRMERTGVAKVDANFGPRHLQFSPNEDTLYVVSEFRATVAAFARNAESGALIGPRMSAPAHALAHLKHGCVRSGFAPGRPADIDDLASRVWGADIQITPDGRFVYVSERTSSQLIAYRVRSDRALAYVGATPTESEPRGFAIDPSGCFLVVCGGKSAHVSAYAVATETGSLHLISRTECGKGANWVQMVERPRGR